jgi:hypothetical protein
VFNGTFGNFLSVNTTINYYWSFSAEKWNGTQWVTTGISGSSAPVVGYAIPALTTLNLPYYVYVLNPRMVNWDEWLGINYTFYWMCNGINYSTVYTAELNVHPADIAGAPVIFPYLGADGSVSSSDLYVFGSEWGLSSVGANPTSNLARADIGNYGSIGGEDLYIFGSEWGFSWTNTPPTSNDPSAVTANGSISGTTSQAHQYCLTVTNNIGTVGPTNSSLDPSSNVTIQTTAPQAVASEPILETTPTPWRMRFKAACTEV